MKVILQILALLILVIVAVILTRGAILYSQVGRYRAYWQAAARQPAQPGAVTFVALGDSGAQGIGASRPEKGYVGLLRSSIEDKTNQEVHMINLSVSGAKVADVSRTQIPQLQKLKIDDATIITLSIGGNDAVHRNPNFAHDIDVLFSQLPKHTIVADIGYFGGGRYYSREAYVGQANPLLRVAAAKYGLVVVPLYEITKQRNSVRNNAVDVFHPSNRGYRNWHDAFWPEVKKRLE